VRSYRLCSWITDLIIPDDQFRTRDQLRRMVDCCTPCEMLICTGKMSDASEVLSAIYESLSMVEDGQKLVRELFEWQVSPPPLPPPCILCS